MTLKVVDREAMWRATAELEAKEQEIHQLQRTLQDEVRRLTDVLDGADSAMCQIELSRFDAEFEQVKEGLQKTHGFLIQSLQRAGEPRLQESPR